jgi:hypothetical protein
MRAERVASVCRETVPLRLSARASPIDRALLVDLLDNAFLQPLDDGPNRLLVHVAPMGQLGDSVLLEIEEPDVYTIGD